MADQADLVLKVPTEDLLQYRLNARRRYQVPEGAPEDAFKLYGGNERFIVRTALVRSEDYKAGRSPKAEGPGDIAKLCRHLTVMDQEFIVTLAVNNQGRLVAIHEAAVGSADKASTTARDIIKLSLLTGSAGIVLVHNHPSGNPKPSSDDLVLTGKVKMALGCIGGTLLDHVIVGVDGYYSVESGGWSPWL